MNKKVNLIIGSGVLGAYLSYVLLKKKEKVIVTSRNKKKNYKNYTFLKIHKKIKFEKLDINDSNQIKKIILKYKPEKIFYFAGQSSLIKSKNLKKETYSSHYLGTKNFLSVLKKNKIKSKFFKSNSGYIFNPQKKIVNFNCKLAKNKNPYIVAQQKSYKLIKKYRKYNLNLFNLIFFQIESPLRPNDFFIKKVCLHAKKRKKILVGNINTFRDYSWAPEIAKAVYLISNTKPKDIIISAGKSMSGLEILKYGYKLNNLDYKKYYKINKIFERKNENKYLISDKKNNFFLKKKLKFSFKIYRQKLLRLMYQNI